VVPELEQMGFFFVGIKPMSTLGDAVILQYFNNVTIDYDTIQLASPMSEELRSYVRRHDPNSMGPGLYP
ncbi:MAG: hypothetical protein M1378_03010, partial [Bacteroidetes bacterium]|nr:hypothetical protein [Bacteroidota bacterium]